MIECIKAILNTLTGKQKIQALLLEALLVLRGLSEVLGFSAIVAFIMMILDMENALQNAVFRLIQESLGIENGRMMFVSICVIMVLLFVVKYISALLSKYCMSKFIYDQEAIISQSLYRKYIHWPYEQFFEESSYGFHKKILSDPRGYSRVLETVLEWIGEMIKAAAIFAVLMILNWKITCFIAAGGILAAWVYLRVFTKWSKNLGEQRDELYKAQNKQLNQSFTGIREIILDGKQDYHAERFTQYSRSYNHAEQVFSVLSDLPWIYFEAIGTLGALVFILVILLFVHQPAEILTQISVFALLIVKVIPVIQKTVNVRTVVNYYDVPFHTVAKEFSRSDVREKTCIQTEKEGNMCYRKELVLNNISYRYPSAEENALNGVSLRIPAGSFIGISGASGSGKSTLIDIICGLLQPMEGVVSADGCNIASNLSQWRKMVAYIPQNVFLFEDTLKHNIAPGIPDAKIDEEKLWEAICKAQLEDVVRQLPLGLDEPLGERGIRLSGGQCQRIAIARALYKDPQLLVLDEATSSLDAQTEQEILNSVKKLKGTVTVISVAHKESALELCDVRFVVEKGTVKPYEK